MASHTIIQSNITSQNINPLKTLNILEAAQFLGAHKETIRRMAASGEIPGVKIGRGWRFIENDLANHMRSQYGTMLELSVTNSRSKPKWQLQKETTSGGLTSPTKEKEYAKALGLK